MTSCHRYSTFSRRHPHCTDDFLIILHRSSPLHIAPLAAARRPCFEAPTCLPAIDTIITGSLSASSISLSAEAALTPNGAIRLLNGANKIASAFHVQTAPLLQGFTASFNFLVTDPCTDGTFCSTLGIGCCNQLSGGFAFVVQAADSPVQTGGTCTAIVRTKMPRYGGSGPRRDLRSPLCSPRSRSVLACLSPSVPYAVAVIAQ